MGEVTAERAKQITDEANGDAKKVSDKYKESPSNGVAEANKVLQDEVSASHKRDGLTPEERKLYVQALTKKLEEGDDGQGKNALLPKISEAWLSDPASTVMTKRGLSEDSINLRLEHNNERIEEGSPNADLAILQNQMLQDIKKKYFAEGSSGENVSLDTVKSDVANDESQRVEKVKTDTQKNQDWDAAKALLANNGKLFNAVDQMGGSSIDGRISQADLNKFCAEARAPKDQPNPFNQGAYSEDEIKAMETLRDRYNVLAMGSSAGSRNIESFNFLLQQNFITRDSLAEGLGQNKDEMVKSLGEKKYPDDSAVKTDAPKTDVPTTDASKTDPAKTDAPTTDASKTDPAKTDAPKTDVPKTDASKTDPAKTDAPKTDVPKKDAPKTDPAKTNASKTDPAKTPQFGDLSKEKQDELKKNVSAKLQVGQGQGYWQVADQVLRLHGNKKPTTAEVRELTEILKKSNVDENTGKPRTVLHQRALLLAADSKEFKDLLNRMAS